MEEAGDNNNTENHLGGVQDVAVAGHPMLTVL
jgi:hypothetical protein